MRNSIITYIVVIAIFVRNSASKDIGDSCRVARTSEPGTCKMLSDCESARQDIILNGLFPIICGFVTNHPIVCCLNPIERIESTYQPSNRTSVRKCNQYKDSVYEEVLILNQPPRKVLQCPFSNVALILGGILASPNEFPHMALIGYQANNTNEIYWGCSGSLISENFVLTAAHCVLTPRFIEPPKFVLLGAHGHRETNDVHQRLQVNVAESITHPGFKKPSKYNDIGLIRLDRKINFNRYMRPACLPDTFDTNTPKVIATGWGETNYRGDGGSKTLLKLVFDLFTVSECNDTYRNDSPTAQLNRGIIHDVQFCAGTRANPKDVCQIDVSGGPVQIYHPQHVCMYTIAGVTSLGNQCGNLDAPGIYTRVFSFLDWIEQHVWPDEQ